MRASDAPQIFGVPFGAQADPSTINAIPRTKPDPGRASMNQGFPSETFLPLAAGGIPPFGEDMNGILNMLSRAAQAAELGLLRPFSASYAEAVGGYPAGATVAHPSISGRFLICTQDENRTDPSQSLTGWIDPLSSFLPINNPTTNGPLTVSSGGSGPDFQMNASASFNQQQRGQITWGGRSWYPGSDGLILRDNNNPLIDAAQSSGPTTIQRLTVQAAHGQKVAFPQQFTDDNVQVAIISRDSGGNLFHNVDWFSIDRYGVVVSLNSWTGNGYVNEHGLTWMTIIAFGEML